MSAFMSAVLTLADDPPADVDPITGKGPEWGKAAPIGLLVILLMGIATFFLLRSMTRKIKNVPASFDPPDEVGAAAEPAEPAPSAVAGREAEAEPGGPGMVDERSG